MNFFIPLRLAVDTFCDPSAGSCAYIRMCVRDFQDQYFRFCPMQVSQSMNRKKTNVGNVRADLEIPSQM